ncbi:MAG: substrate-binding domain-containing protein [Victivallales bacterium]|nr:substrate-binding domain-containing protein [Victivallales bacterium]
MRTQLNYKQIVLNREKSMPLYLQLAGELRRLIGETRADGSDKLPSALQLSRSLGIDRATVGKAFRELLTDGIIRQGSPRVLRISPEARGQLRPFPCIGIILPHPFSITVDGYGGFPLLYMKGVIDAAAKQNISTIMVQPPTPDAGYQEIESFLDELEGRLLGVVHLGNRTAQKDRPLERLLQRASIPQVLISAVSPLSHIGTVTADARPGAHALAEQLLAFGHRRVGIVNKLPANGKTKGDLPIIFEVYSREARLQQSFQEHGLCCDQRYLCHGCANYSATLHALTQKKATGALPTAYCCINDEVANWTLRALAELGLKVPDDISVIGFDGADMAATTGLTTIQLPFYAIGVKGLELLLDIQNGALPQEERHLELPTSLVIRQTLGRSPENTCLFGKSTH